MINVILASMAVGFITASLGAIKDSPHEGFKRLTYFRSPGVCVMWGVAGGLIFPDQPLILLACFSSVCERVSVETWKALIRKKPSKFNWGEAQDRGWFINRKKGG